MLLSLAVPENLQKDFAFMAGQHLTLRKEIAGEDVQHIIDETRQVNGVTLSYTSASLLVLCTRLGVEQLLSFNCVGLVSFISRSIHVQIQSLDTVTNVNNN